MRYFRYTCVTNIFNCYATTHLLLILFDFRHRLVVSVCVLTASVDGVSVLSFSNSVRKRAKKNTKANIMNKKGEKKRENETIESH